MTGKLILEDGTILEGESFGASGGSAGEVVFNTAMTGYPESLTDPSYRGQILVATFPMIGNYGVPSDTDENGLSKFLESEAIHIKGLIIADYAEKYSHWNADKSLAEWLKEYNIPALSGIDTRALTKKLRENGTMLGKIEFEEKVELEDPSKRNLVAEVSVKEPVTYGKGDKKVILVDCGVKNNIIRCLIDRGVEVKRVPWDYDYTQEEYDGLFISNGPGDPEQCEVTVNHIKTAIQQEKPIFGICLGNQLLGLAAGGSTFKLKYGHRSHNQPVIKVGSKKAYITSQNHGYALDDKSLSKDWETYFTNLNDDTCEGIRHKTKPFFSAQFHPEAKGGPVDTEFLFDDFIKSL